MGVVGRQHCTGHCCGTKNPQGKDPCTCRRRLQRKILRGRTMPSVRKPLGIPVLDLCCPSKPSSRQGLYKWFILFLTFIVYMAYHMSRKPISVVKNSKEFLDCSNKESCESWVSKMNGTSEESAKGDLANLDLAYLISYAGFMFVSGWVAERMDLRYFLSGGMILSGVVTFFFGFAYTAGIHGFGYLIAMQVLSGVFQSTGWPGVVTVVANWFGKGRKGLIMGIWNSHTSIGNVLGNTIAGAFVETNWGLSFMVPGIGIAAAGLVMFFLLAPSPQAAGFQPEQDEESADEKEEKKEEEEKAISLFGALKIPGVVEFSLCLFFSKLVAYTFLYWLPNYIHETSQVDGEQAANLANFFDYGGILGGISAGILTDKTKKPAITCAIMLTMAIPCLLLYQALVSDWCPIHAVDGLAVKDSCYAWNIAMTFIIGFFVNGPYCLITTAVSAELGQHPSLQGSSKALATVTAIIDGTGSIGAALGPFLCGRLSGSGN